MPVELDARSVLLDQEGEVEEILDALPEIVRVDDELEQVHPLRPARLLEHTRYVPHESRGLLLIDLDVLPLHLHIVQLVEERMWR